MPANEIKKKPFKMLARAEKDGHTSERTIIGDVEPIHKAAKGSTVRELDYSRDAVSPPAATLCVFDQAMCCCQFISPTNLKAEESRSFLSRNINFFTFIHESQINAMM